MPDPSPDAPDPAGFRQGQDMDERNMSVMQRLKAIRDRMAAQNELPDNAVDPAPAGDPPLPGDSVPQDGVPLPGRASAQPAAMPTLSAPVSGGSSSMWDMINDDDDLLAGGDGPLPGFDDEPHDPRPEIRRPFSGFPAAVPTPPSAAPVPFAAAPAAPMPRPVAEAPPEAVRRTGRVKTRLLGFEHSTGHTTDIFERAGAAPPTQGVRFPVGWLVVIDGPGRGASIALRAGVAQIGRDEGQGVQLDFGDTSISRTNHAAIAYDAETRTFFVGHGGKSNLVRLNARPLLSTEPMKNGDTLLIGETRLRLVALCDEHFSWNDQSEQPGF